MRFRLVVVLCGFLAMPLPGQSPSVPPDSLHDAYVDVNGVHLHYRVGGRGPALVLLHGLTQTGAFWSSLAPQLVGEHTVIVPDLRGHGRSTNPSEVFRHPDVATDVLHLLDRLGIREFALLGHSTGAGVALHIASRLPDRVTSMMIIGLAHRIPDEQRAAWARYPSYDSLPSRQRDYWLGLHPGGRIQVEQVLGYLRHLADSVQDLNLPRDMVARIKAPTFIIFGDHDGNRVEIATELYRSLPKAQLWVVPQSGHFPVWPGPDGSAEAAAAFPKVVKAFFASPEAKRAK